MEKRDFFQIYLQEERKEACQVVNMLWKDREAQDELRSFCLIKMQVFPFQSGYNPSGFPSLRQQDVLIF